MTSKPAEQLFAIRSSGTMTLFIAKNDRFCVQSSSRRKNNFANLKIPRLMIEIYNEQQ